MGPFLIKSFLTFSLHPTQASVNTCIQEVFIGVIAQLGERYNGIVEVRGSTPRGSTNLRSSSFGWQANQKRV